MTGSEIVKKYDAMNDNVVGNWMNLWQECADWAMPTNDNINRIRVSGQEKPPQRLIDSCIEANFNFASGFFSHMFPPNTIWAKFRHPSPSMMQNEEVAKYFEDVSREIHQVLLGSNFAQQEFESLLCMGTFGTNCLAVEEDDKNVVRFRNFLISNVRIAENYLGYVDVVCREFELDARQAIQQFGKDVLMEKGLEKIINDDVQQKGTKYKFIHMVCPREDFDKSKRDKLNKPFASIYVCREGDVVVKEGGFNFNPYKVSRFVTGNGEVYGRGPMSMVLGTARRSNAMERSVVISAEQHTNPQWLVPDDDSVKGLSSRASAIIKYRAGNPNGKPERLPPNGDPGIGVELLDRYESRIDKFFFNHLFRPLEDYRNMTAFEANERVNTDLMALAPFTSRYTDEKVTPLMEQVYYFCQKRGRLPEIPPALAEDPRFDIDYVGRMSLASKSFEVMGALDTIRVFAELSQGVPSLQMAFDNLQVDKLFTDTWYSKSASMNALKSPVDRDEERAERAQAQQQQQMVDNLAPVADAAQKLSGATDPTSILTQLQGE